MPASGLLQSGRIYAEVNGPVNTGLAIANPNNQAATITFNFTDTAGQAFESGTTTVAANSQVAAFLDQTPFNGGNFSQWNIQLFIQCARSGRRPPWIHE